MRCPNWPYLTYSYYILLLRCGHFPFEFRLVYKWKGPRAQGLPISIFVYYFFIGVELWLTRLEFVSWRWCCLVFDFFILDGSYVTLLPWPVFTLICLGSNLITWKTLFSCLVHHCFTPWSKSNQFLTTFKPFDLCCNLLAVIHHNWVIRIDKTRATFHQFLLLFSKIPQIHMFFLFCYFSFKAFNKYD